MSSFSSLLWTVGSIVCVSIASFSGIFLLVAGKKRISKGMLYLVSFAAGALLGNVFFHVLPESIEAAEEPHFTLALVLLGMLGSFVLEKFIHWHHCHHMDCNEHHHHPKGMLLLVGDGLHNILDGALIAAAFLADVRVGIATTIAVLSHEIPQEIGDVAVLLHSGYSRVRALLLNALSALSALVGGIAVWWLGSSFDSAHMVPLLLPLVAGNFLYIAAVDLVPEMHKETNPQKSGLQLVSLLAGAALLFAVSSGHDHEHHEDNDEHAHTVHAVEV